MSTSNDSRVERIFSAAAELDAEARREYLDRECGGDGALRREVDSLLEAAAAAGPYFDDLASRLGIQAFVDANATQVPEGDSLANWDGATPGMAIGPYTLDEPIGAGGMGTVWRAHRSDGRFEGNVAIKLLRLAGGPTAARRFELEGRYLARLDHPNIARLLDAGVGPQGAPYLVLEFVEGTAIDRYCDEHRLTIRDRIRRFVDVLAAVTHAHAHLIVHRDLKPSNILVTDGGAVKLLDFGVAKLLARDEITAADDVTREVGAALTPAYASPEQLRGETITTATDVYSLGLVLAVLLAGRSPRARTAPATMSDFRALATEEPPALSDLVTTDPTADPEELTTNAECRGSSPASLARTLRGDLDNIARKALAPDPEDRYGTVGELADDLGRYLRDEPVRAQPPTMGYRVHKFVRRHRGGVLVACLTSVALIATAAIAAWQAVEASRQRDVAVYEQQRTQASAEFFSLMFEELGPEGEPLTPVELLDRGAALLEQQYGVEERFVGRLSYDVSRRYSNLGAKDKELELLKRAETIAREQRDDELLASVHCTTAKSVMPLNPDRARELAAEGQQLFDRLRDPSIDTRVACSRLRARLLEVEGDRESAIAVLEELQAELDRNVASSVHQRGITLNDLALLYFRTNRFDESFEILDEILEMLERAGRGYTVGYLRVLANRGVLLASVGEILAQQEIWEEVARRSRQLEELGRNPPSFHMRMAMTLIRLDRYEEALELLLEARAVAIEAGDEHSAALADKEIGQTLHALDRHEEAERRLDAAEAVLKRLPKTHDRHLNTIQLSRAVQLREEGRFEEARKLARTALDELGYPETRNASSLQETLKIAAGIELAAERYEDAERFAADQVASAEAKARAPHRSANVGEALVQLAKARIGAGRVEPAVEDLSRAVEAFTNSLGEDHPRTVEARELLDDPSSANAASGR